MSPIGVAVFALMTGAAMILYAWRMAVTLRQAHTIGGDVAALLRHIALKDAALLFVLAYAVASMVIPQVAAASVGASRARYEAWVLALWGAALVLPLVIQWRVNSGILDGDPGRGAIAYAGLAGLIGVGAIYGTLSLTLHLIAPDPTFYFVEPTVVDAGASELVPGGELVLQITVASQNEPGLTRVFGQFSCQAAGATFTAQAVQPRDFSINEGRGDPFVRPVEWRVAIPGDLPAPASCRYSHVADLDNNTLQITGVDFDLQPAGGGTDGDQ